MQASDGHFSPVAVPLPIRSSRDGDDALQFAADFSEAPPCKSYATLLSSSITR